MKSSTLGGRGQSVGDHRGQLSPASRRRRVTIGGSTVPKRWSWVPSEVRRGNRSDTLVAGPNMLRLELTKSSVRAGERSGAGFCGPMMLYLVSSNCSLMTGDVDAPGGQQSECSMCGPRIVVRGALKSAAGAGRSSD